MAAKNYLPTYAEFIIPFRYEYSYKDVPNPPFWQSLGICLERANKGDETAMQHFQQLYGLTSFPNLKEQKKYVQAAMSILHKTPLDEMVDRATQQQYSPEIFKYLTDTEIPDTEEWGDNPNWSPLFDERLGMPSVKGPTYKRGKQSIESAPDPYQQIMNAINFGIDKTSHKNRFFVHTIFETIPLQIKSLPPGQHIRIITLIPYIFDAKGWPDRTIETAPENHATIIIADRATDGKKRIAFAEPNHIVWRKVINPDKETKLFKIPRKKEMVTLDELKEIYFDALLSPNPMLRESAGPQTKEIMISNMEFLKEFSNGAEKIFLDLPAFNDYGPNCTRLCLYFIIYYIFISTRSDELGQFAIVQEMNKETGKPLYRTPRGHFSDKNIPETRVYDKILPILYGLLRDSHGEYKYDEDDEAVEPVAKHGRYEEKEFRPFAEVDELKKLEKKDVYHRPFTAEELKELRSGGKKPKRQHKLY